MNITQKNKSKYGEKIYNLVGHNSFRILKLEDFKDEVKIIYILTGTQDDKKQVYREYVKK